MYKIKKILRFSAIYGVRRAVIKALGRLRVGSAASFIINPLCILPVKKNVAIIGCGQFAFSTIAFFLVKKRRACIKYSYDIDEVNSKSFARSYLCKSVFSIDTILEDPDVEYVYISSNHFTHTDYAIKCLNAQKTVYVEKPLSVNFDQFDLFISAKNNSQQKVYIGYNRPFSQAILNFKKNASALKSAPFTLNCFIIGHVLPTNHWYRNNEEGTRICGNLGHWIDLFIHLLFDRINDVHWIDYTITLSNKETLDDDLSISFVTNLNDLGVINMTSRSEPFEGINETINIQCDSHILKIDDFRRSEYQNGDVRKVLTHSPKDVGHKKAILQPFETRNNRKTKEWLISTYIMLYVTDAIKKNIYNGRIQKVELMERLKSDANYTKSEV